MTVRSALTPSSAIPLAYYAVAHAGLAGALLVLVVDPALPGTSFYHPRMVALVHLLTIPWISGSILGSFYIVGPLALCVAMSAGTGDWVAFSSFVAGTISWAFLPRSSPACRDASCRCMRGIAHWRRKAHRRSVVRTPCHTPPSPRRSSCCGRQVCPSWPVGLPLENHLAIRLAALLLLSGVSVGAAYILYMLRRSRLR